MRRRQGADLYFGVSAAGKGRRQAQRPDAFNAVWLDVPRHLQKEKYFLRRHKKRAQTTIRFGRRKVEEIKQKQNRIRRNALSDLFAGRAN